MANSYLESIQQARRFVQDHKEDWEAIDKKILDIVGNAQKITSVPISEGSLKELNTKLQQEISLRKELGGVVDGYKKQVQSLQTQLKKLSATEGGRKKQLTDEERQLRTLQKSEERLIDVKSKHWKQIEANRKAANLQAKSTRALGSSYDEASNQLRLLTKEYQDLAIRKARSNDLTDQEVLKMDALEKQVTELRTQLVQVDHSVGQFGRSVGSYGKSFDSLGFSMAQITREMPAFAYGAQIGFAALSNNIPMLFDEIEKVRLETARLRKEGKATRGVMSQLGSSFFGFQTMLSVGVTLLTLYGADLIELAFGASEAEKAQDKLNEAIAEGKASSKEASQEMRTYVKIVQDAEASEEAREGALKALKEEVTELKDVELDQRDAMQQVIDKTGPYIKATEARAKADAFARLAAEAEAKLLEAQDKSLQESIKWYDYAWGAIKNVGQGGAAVHDMVMAGAKNHNEAVIEQKKIYDMLTETYEQYMMEALEAESGLADATNGSTDATRGRIKAIDEMNKMQRYSVAYYQEVISALEDERKNVARSSKEWDQYTKSIEEAQKAISIIQDIQQFARDEMAMSDDELTAFSLEVTTKLSMDGIERGMKQLEDITGETTEELYHQMLNWYGSDWEAFLEFSEAKLRQKEYETEQIKDLQKEIADAAVEFGSALFEAEIEKIEQRIDANRDFYAQILAGEELTEERRAALEAERDLKERQLLKEKRKRENEQFLFEQGVALARVAMNTAVAITAALPNIPLATLIGILGGIQAATIIAQSIPKFEKGTENAPEGWAIVDEVRPEVHTDKHGNVKSFGSDKGSNLRFLEQGDKIHRSREDYFNKLGPGAIENTVFDLNMQHQGRSVQQKDVDSALLREVSALRGENTKVWREVKKLASRPIHNSIEVTVPDNRPY